MTATATLAEYVRHAELFGSECVYETAEVDLSGTELIQLDRELTRIDTERRRRFGKVPQRKRMSLERKRQTVVWLTNEGLPATRIAEQLGLSVRRVEELRQDARRIAAESSEPAKNVKLGE